MTKFELSISGLAAIALVGLIILMALDREISNFLPIVTALISFVLGMKKDNIIALIRGK